MEDTGEEGEGERERESEHKQESERARERERAAEYKFSIQFTKKGEQQTTGQFSFAPSNLYNV